MKTKRGFLPNANRHQFDVELCKQGWSQIDTGQDASYFGVWCNPVELKVFEFCEGDTMLAEAETGSEFVELLRSMEKSHGGKFAIDPALYPDSDQPFIAMGLSDLMYVQETAP